MFSSYRRDHSLNISPLQKPGGRLLLFKCYMNNKNDRNILSTAVEGKLQSKSKLVYKVLRLTASLINFIFTC